MAEWWEAAPVAQQEWWEAAPKADAAAAPGQAVARDLGLGVRDVIEGAASLSGMALDAVTWPGRAIQRAVGIPTTAPSDLAQQAINATGLPQPETSGEQLRSAAIRGGASALTTAGLGAVPGVAAQFPIVTNALMTAIPSQVVGGLTGGTAGEATRQAGGGPLAQTAAAILGGGAGALATQGAGRVLSPVRPTGSPERAALVQGAQDEGIPLSVGQETGSRFLKNVEGGFAQLPFTSGVEARLAETQQRAFNRAVLSRAGVDADIATPEVLNAARARIGGTINEVANRNTLTVTPVLQGRLAEVEDSLRFLPAEVAAPIRSRIEQLRGMMIPVGSNSGLPIPMDAAVASIPGASYRMMDSQLGRAIRSTTDGDRRAALGDLRETLRQAMDASISQEDQAIWQMARRQYANLMVAADAAKGAGEKAAEGNISPLALRGAVDQHTAGGYVWGRGDLNDLARLGQGVLRPPPDSGTAGRSQAMQLLQGGLSAGGAASGVLLGGPVVAAAGAVAPYVLPRIAQAAMQSRPGRAYLTNQLGMRFDTNLPASALAALAASEAQRNRLAPSQ